MVRKGLIMAALLAVATPLAAQEEWVWTSDRPDAAGPIGITGTTTLPAGAIELTYQWVQQNTLGVWNRKDSLDLATTLSLYEVAPLSNSDRRHTIGFAYGLSDNMTLRARGEFAMIERESQRDNGQFFIMSTSALGDFEVDLTYNVAQQGPYRIDVNVGTVVPIGKSATYAVSAHSSPAEEATPYDMRPGSGSFGVMAGASFDYQNEISSIGGQFHFRTYLNENSRGFTLGDRYASNLWIAYNVTESISVNSGIRWEKWGNIDGADSFLATIMMRDPMNNGVLLSGNRATLPLGVTFMMPEGTSVEGHRFSFETLYAVHHDYDGPQNGMDWGINVGYSVPF